MAVDELRPVSRRLIPGHSRPRVVSVAAGPAPRFPYVAALDGMRGVAILLVLVYHAWQPIVPGGTIGVDVFFVLSGFLITGLLLHEKSSTGRISLLRFYGRRALRLLPPLVPLLAAATIYARLNPTAPLSGATLQGVRATLEYASNWLIPHGISLGWLSHTWSLSAEEQFYAVWPPLLVAMLVWGGRRVALGGCVMGVGAVIEERILMTMHGGISFNRIYMGLDTRADALLIGCALALAVDLGLLGRLRTRTVAAAGLAGLAVLAIASIQSNLPMAPYGFTVLALSAGALIAAVAVRPWGPLTRLLSLAPLVAVGRVSYAMYLWHYLIYGVVMDQLPGLPPAMVLVLVLVFSWLAAQLSDMLIESPCAALRRRLTSLPRRALRVAPVAPVAPVAQLPQESLAS